MNLGNLIDPAWAQGGFAERWPRKANGIAPTKVVRTHEQEPAQTPGASNASRACRRGLCHDIRMVLIRDGGWMAAEAVLPLLPPPAGSLPPVARKKVIEALWSLRGLAHASIRGKKGAYEYRITDLGRARAKAVMER